MSGYIRDPRVGRDVLIGCAIAVGLALGSASTRSLPPLFGRPPAAADVPVERRRARRRLRRSSAHSSTRHLVSGIFQAMFGVLAYVLLRLAFRRTACCRSRASSCWPLFRRTSVLTSGAPTWIAALYQLVVVTAVVIMRRPLRPAGLSRRSAVDGMLESHSADAVLVALDGDRIQPDDGAGHRPRAASVSTRRGPGSLSSATSPIKLEVKR